MGSKKTADEAIDPCGAIKMVYDQFPHLEGFSEEITFKEPYLTNSSFSKVRCKRVYHPDDTEDFQDTWLILADSEMIAPEYRSAVVDLKLVRLSSEQVHNVLKLNNPRLKEYDVKRELKKISPWYRNGETFISASLKGDPNLPLRVNFEVRPFASFQLGFETGLKDNPVILALSRFFALIAK